MAVTVTMPLKFRQSLFEGRVTWSSGTVKAMLLASFTPASLADTAQFISDISASYTEATGGGSTGYTAGGLALSSKTLTTTAANSWATQRANSTAYAVGDVVRPAAANGYLYRATSAGTSGGSVPTYPTVIGQTVADGGVTWENVGSGITVVDAADPQWTTSAGGSLVAAWTVYYVDTGTASTSPVICWWDLGGTQTASNGGQFTLTLSPLGITDIAT